MSHQSIQSGTQVDYGTSLLFSVGDSAGELEDILRVLKQHSINMTKIESRPSKEKTHNYDIFVELDPANKKDEVAAAIVSVKERLNTAVRVFGGEENKVAWFPRRIQDLDNFAAKTLEYGSDLSSDHPGFTDKEYRKRRSEIVEIAQVYKHGEVIPRIDYTEQEIETWGKVYTKLKSLYPTHACSQHCHIFPLLEENCGYGEKSIPQLQDVSKFLKDCTGFTLRPVQGLLSSRDFLNGLAFRVFHSTQYIRHHSKPFYTPEPDVCHELLGHVPLFADPEFAEFSQEIGLASLGATDEDIVKLATCYWFTVEFGLCKDPREENKVKAFGAGLLSSFGELEYCLSDANEKRAFDPFEACKQEYPITQFQPVYYVASSFEDAKKKLKEFSDSLNRPFQVWYNDRTQSVEVLDTKESLVSLARRIHNEMATLTRAMALN